MCFCLAQGCRKGDPNTKWFGIGKFRGYIEQALRLGAFDQRDVDRISAGFSKNMIFGNLRFWTFPILRCVFFLLFGWFKERPYSKGQTTTQEMRQGLLKLAKLPKAIMLNQVCLQQSNRLCDSARKPRSRKECPKSIAPMGIASAIPVPQDGVCPCVRHSALECPPFSTSAHEFERLESPPRASEDHCLT